MNASTCVNLHCHSNCSDGSLPPEEAARRLADAGVVFAALTDHDTVDGLPRFRAALHRRGIGSVSGVELTATWRGEEVHLLVYGFDPAHAEWLDALRALRLYRHAAIQSVADAMRRSGAATHAAMTQPAATTPAAGGQLPVADAIALAHRAGGRTFLAHPLLLRPNPAELRAVLAELQACGLDGVEALYAPAPAEAQPAVVQMAADLGLLVCAGTDFHGPEDGRAHGLGIEMPNTLWQPFRDALRLEAATTATRAAAAYGHARRTRRQFGLHIILPSVLAIGLFIATFWAFLLPAFEHALLDRKREMIRELTHSAWSILADAERQVSAGRLTRAQAQTEARDRIAALRYGRENKDYFWLQDMHPRMIMHPYRLDLNGQDLTDFRDARGARIFVEFADVVRRHHEGYVDYVWQWPDDPRRLEPKESYVKGFDPWEWVVGTGLYIEDVRHEIARLERGLVHASLIITGFVALLLLHVVRHSRRLDRERAESADDLHATTERYRSLVEAATEGTLLVLDGRCHYANPHLLALLGYSAAELGLLDLTEVLPAGGTNTAIWQRIGTLQRQADAAPGSVAGELRRRDGAMTPCTLALTHITWGGRDGMVLLARETGDGRAGPSPQPVDTPLSEAATHAPTGLFRARADHRGALLAANAIAARCLRAAARAADDTPVTLADVFGDHAAFAAFVDRLKRDGTADCRLPITPADGPLITLALRATLTRDDAGQPAAIDGLVEDISSLVQREQERDTMIERLQTSMLFLHEPVGHVLAAGRAARTPTRTAAGTPSVTVPGSTPVYEALLRMQEQHVQDLTVVDDKGLVLGSLSDRDLLPFQQYGAVVLTSEISRAALVGDVVRGCRRTALTVKALLDSGAHPRNVTRLISSVCDAATERFVQLAVEELGPPPARFAFMALGSQGRQEQTLVTDQDNAIVYAPPESPARTPEITAYFLELGRRVCGWLNEAGYPFCRGRFMAQNPVWTRDLTAWRRHFSYWAARAEPAELLTFTVFFDFRAVYGDTGLIADLRRHVFAELRNAPAFFPHFARHALLFRPPVMLFGRIVMGGTRNAAAGTLDLKAAMLPIVAFARLYALHHDVARANTLERLDALADAGKLSPASRDEIGATYTFLMRLRLKHQVQGFHAGHDPDNLIELRRLGRADRTLLRQAFAHIRILQRRIAYDFLGGTHE